MEKDKSMKNTFIITHKKKQFVTKHYYPLSKEECNLIRENFFNKPNFGEVISEIKNLYYKQSKKISKIYSYYFYELAADCKLLGCKWSIKEFIESDDLLRFAVGKIRNNTKFFGISTDMISSIKTVFRLSPSGTAGKLSNFPYKTASMILNSYMINNNYYDFSCGWGVRLTSALSKNINYFGTDPNTSLVTSLLELSDAFKQYTSTTSKVDIRNQGSEVFVKEWENTIGLAFSSPPYFTLEEYSLSNPEGQSTYLFSSYEVWLEKYMLETLKNIENYLVDDGYLALNIKNMKDYLLYDDVKKLISSLNFDYIEDINLENINRVILKNNNKTTDENIMIYRRRKR